MGSSTTQWCDRCGKIDNKLIEYWFGEPEDFIPRRDWVETKCKAEVCADCLKTIMKETKTWTNHKENPK